ncbi:hypothetical protein [Candidatus Palauibacter sp.]|uniref:hypothetical protein n=1 Tax=Candidatus Palauibacter sp. TaxID=3101350 RepID=UPI003B596FF6
MMPRQRYSLVLGLVRSDAATHAQAYDAAEGAGALSRRGPTELNAVNRGSIGRQAEKADALQQWLQLAD